MVFRYSSVERWLNLWILIFGIGSLGFVIFYEISVFVLLITSIVLMVLERKTVFSRRINDQEKIFLALLFFYFSSQLYAVLYQPSGYEYDSITRQLSAFDNVSRWLLLIPLWLIFRAYPIDWISVGIGLAIGALVATAHGHYQVYHLNEFQAEGSFNSPISYAQLMVVSDIILWFYAARAWTLNKRLLAGFFFFASLAAFYGSLLAVTRGAWVVYLVVIIFWSIFIIAPKNRNLKNLWAPQTMIRVLSALVVFYLVSQTDHYQHMQGKTVATISGLTSGDLDAATASRYSNFKIAVASIKENPFGIGIDNYMATNERFGHAHNELLNTAVEAGIHGAFGLIGLFCYLAFAAVKKVVQPTTTVNIFAASGLILTSCYFIFFQSASVFSHHHTLIFFIVYAYLFFARIFNEI